jgi:hypothetical protein
MERLRTSKRTRLWCAFIITYYCTCRKWTNGLSQVGLVLLKQLDCRFESCCERSWIFPLFWAVLSYTDGDLPLVKCPPYRTPKGFAVSELIIPRRPGFVHGSGHVGFLVDRVVLG